jgi:hypothetical protein
MRNSYSTGLGIMAGIGSHSTLNAKNKVNLTHGGPFNPLSPNTADGKKAGIEEDSEYDDEDDDGTTPGPGAYFNP